MSKPFLVGMGSGDPTYGPAALIFAEVLSSHGIELTEDRILHLDHKPFQSKETHLILEGMKDEILDSDFLFTFTPNTLQKMVKWFADKQINLKASTILGSVSLLSIPIIEADIVLESDILEHGKQAARMLKEWHISGEVPSNSFIPMKLT